MTSDTRARSIVLGQNALEVLPPDSAEPVEMAKGFSLTPNGLQIEGKPPFNRWDKVGRMLCTTERGIQFSLGDYLNALEAEFGEDHYHQIVDYGAGWSQKTCDVYRWLATRVSYERRRMDKLGVRHHMLIAPLEAAKQKEWLDRAADDEDGAWTVARLRQALMDGEDAPVNGWWVLVAANDPQDQLALQAQIEGMGRTCKAIEKRTRK